MEVGRGGEEEWMREGRVWSSGRREELGVERERGERCSRECANEEVVEE